MATLRNLWVIHTTSTEAGADTDDGFQLVIRASNVPYPERARLTFPDLPHDERERGRTDQYRFDVLNLNIDMFGLGGNNFCIQTLGSDAWLPASIWVIGRDVTGLQRLLVSLPFWPDNLWFSKDTSEGREIRCLDDPWVLLAERSAEGNETEHRL
jgi:hypothetical protein